MHSESCRANLADVPYGPCGVKLLSVLPEEVEVPALPLFPRAQSVLVVPLIVQWMDTAACGQHSAQREGPKQRNLWYRRSGAGEEGGTDGEEMRQADVVIGMAM
jgi:hypothetical protein